MPVFEYECADCGHRMEILEKRAGSHKYKCEKCKSPKLEKLLSGFSVGRSSPLVCKSCPGGSYQSNICPPGGCCGQA
ncbi:MAG: hypothetical protein JW720_08075 [Sedimentisphaerales bacterium]|nr:hypothetical protein [Sedimentisphaerales bacterium]